MGAFEYLALDRRGRETRGIIEGDTPRHVRGLLRERGMTPLEVSATKSQRHTESEGPRVSGGASMGATDLAVITRQLATLVRSGLTLESALRAVGQQAEKAKVKTIILAVRARVTEGFTLAQALGDYPKVFSELFRATVAAGEQSGHLDTVLERLADYTENRQAMQQKVQLALFYPALLTFIAVVVVVGLLTYVVPKVVQVFENLEQDLPLLTAALIDTSDFLQQWGIFLLIGLVGLVMLATRLLRVEAIRARAHRMLLRLPVVGRLVRGGNTARFARTFSILSSAGVPVLEGMRISAEVMNNIPMRRAVEEAALKVREGAGIYRALDQSRLFPPMTLQLIASGESSGNLEAMLERAAVQQERELETVVAAVLGLLEPILILVMGGVVMIIVIAILLPIFELNQLVA